MLGEGLRAAERFERNDSGRVFLVHAILLDRQKVLAHLTGILITGPLASGTWLAPHLYPQNQAMIDTVMVGKIPCSIYGSEWHVRACDLAPRIEHG